MFSLWEGLIKMSYTIAKSISVNSDGIHLVCASNNVIPRDFTRAKFDGDVVDLFRNIFDGSIKPVKSCSNYAYAYAELKLKRHLKELKVDDFKVYKEGKQEDYFEIWKEALNEARKRAKEKYYVTFEDKNWGTRYYVIKLMKHGFRYTQYESSKGVFNFALANIIEDELLSSYNPSEIAIRKVEETENVGCN